VSGLDPSVLQSASPKNYPQLTFNKYPGNLPESIGEQTDAANNNNNGNQPSHVGKWLSMVVKRRKSEIFTVHITFTTTKI